MKTTFPEVKEKTCRQLYDEFCAKYSVDQVAASKELSMIYVYLREKISKHNGNYHDTPGRHLREMIFTHLGHQYIIEVKKKESPAFA